MKANDRRKINKPYFVTYIGNSYQLEVCIGDMVQIRITVLNTIIVNYFL